MDPSSLADGAASDIPGLGISEAAAQARFDELQASLAELWPTISRFNDDPQTIVVVPSVSLEFALKGSEMQAYEERFLFLLLLLRQPSARVVYVTSQDVRPEVVDYYLALLPGVIPSHARERLFLLAVGDPEASPLTPKILRRPRFIERIRSLIPNRARAHLVPYNTTRAERDLALRLGIPMFGCDPKHEPLGSKSGGRKIFAEAGIAYPRGVEDLETPEQVFGAVADLKRAVPECRAAMVKVEGVSGEGNAAVDLTGLGADVSDEAIEQRVRSMALELESLGFEGFMEKFRRMQGIVEERIVADDVRSPSVQLRITPLGEVELLSTHDQLLEGPSGQSYVGCVFPAADEYASEISREALAVGKVLAAKGVIGRFAIDFLAARQGDAWNVYAIELNLRKGGTTHPFLTLQFLCGGHYDWEANRFVTPTGSRKCFVASDHVESHDLRLLEVRDLFDIAVRHRLHFDPSRQRGVVLHMLASVGDRGRFGLTAVGDDPDDAHELYVRAQRIYQEEARAASTVAAPLG